jgi:hypothetical protein
MRAAAKIIALLLLVLSSWAGETGGKYYSDQEYQNLQSFTERSNFYPDGNSGQLQLLIMCIDRGDAIVLKKLLNAVPNFANVSEGGSRCSPAHWAAFKGNTNLLAVLVKHGADLKKKGTNWDISPLHIVRDANTADFLLGHGADLECKAIYGQTPLLWAAKRGNLELVQYLLKRGADLNIRDENGRTALCFAETAAHTNMAAFLISKGAAQLPAAEKEKLRPEMIAGIFSGARAEHPFAESTLIYGEPLKRRPVKLEEVK